MFPVFSKVRLLVKPDARLFDEDDYRVHEGSEGTVVEVYPSETGHANGYTVDFTDPDVTDGVSCTLLDFSEDQLELIQLSKEDAT